MQGVRFFPRLWPITRQGGVTVCWPISCKGAVSIRCCPITAKRQNYSPVLSQSDARMGLVAFYCPIRKKGPLSLANEHQPLSNPNALALALSNWNLGGDTGLRAPASRNSLFQLGWGRGSWYWPIEIQGDGKDGGVPWHQPMKRKGISQWSYHQPMRIECSWHQPMGLLFSILGKQEKMPLTPPGTHQHYLPRQVRVRGRGQLGGRA